MSRYTAFKLNYCIIPALHLSHFRWTNVDLFGPFGGENWSNVGLSSFAHGPCFQPTKEICCTEWLGGRSGYFFLLGRGEGGVQGPREGEGFGVLLKIPGKGRGSPSRGGGVWEGGSGEFRGGGANFTFFFGAKIPTKMTKEIEGFGMLAWNLSGICSGFARKMSRTSLSI